MLIIAVQILQKRQITTAIKKLEDSAQTNSSSRIVGLSCGSTIPEIMPITFMESNAF
jgi:hypothetical protein